MKNYLGVLVFALLAAVGVNRAAFDGSLEARLISDSLFVVGIFMFFIGLIAVMGAGGIFKGFSYTFKNIFRRSQMKSKTYFDYSQEYEQKLPKEIAQAVFVVGIIFVVTALLIA